MKYLKLFDTYSQYESYMADTENLVYPNISFCKDQTNLMHYNVDPCLSKIIKTTYEWVEIGGVKWATKNVGASSVTDFGQKFSWGGINGYTHDQVSGTCRSKAFKWDDYELGNGGSAAANMTKYNSTDGKTTLESVNDAATVNMGRTWRMPTEDDFNALISATTSTWVGNYQGSGVNGRLFTDNNDSSKVLFFPAAGYCGYNSVYDIGGNGYYWTNHLNPSDVTNGRRFYLNSRDCGIENKNRCLGVSVRGVFN